MTARCQGRRYGQGFTENRVAAMTVSPSPQRGDGYQVCPPFGGLGRERDFHRIPHMSNRTSGTTTGASAGWLRTIAVTSAAMLVASCDEGVLDPHGPVGKAERIILYDSTAIMLAVVIPVIVLTLVFAWWFRAKNSRARYRPDWEYSGRI